MCCKYRLLSGLVSKHPSDVQWTGAAMKVWGAVRSRIQCADSVEPPCAPSSGSYHYLSLHPPFGISRPDRSWSIILSYSRLSYPSLSHSPSYLTLCVSYFHTLSPHSWSQPPAHNSPAWKLYHSQRNQPPSVSVRFCGISVFSRISSSPSLTNSSLSISLISSCS